MHNKLNSAARLLKILNAASSHRVDRKMPNKQRSIDVWAMLFDINEADSIRKYFLVSESINLMYFELKIIRSSLDSLGTISKDTYESKFLKIENLLSPINLASSWDAVYSHLTPDVLTTLSFCKDILPDEESSISDGDLSSIRICLDELKSTLLKAVISDRLRLLIKHHIDLIENALSGYNIVGAKAFREAGRTALGEMIEVKDEILPAKNSEILQKLDATWKKVNSVVDIAIKVEKVAKIGSNIFNFLENLL